MDNSRASVWERGMTNHRLVFGMSLLTMDCLLVTIEYVKPISNPIYPEKYNQCLFCGIARLFCSDVSRAISPRNVMSALSETQQQYSFGYSGVYTCCGKALEYGRGLIKNIPLHMTNIWKGSLSSWTKATDIALCSSVRTFVLDYSFRLMQLRRVGTGKLVLLINSPRHSKGLAATEVSFTQQWAVSFKIRIILRWGANIIMLNLDQITEQGVRLDLQGGVILKEVPKSAIDSSRARYWEIK